MFAYIIRRIFAAAALLLVVSAVTFAIFFLLPRFAGETADQLAAQYIGKNPSPEAIAAVKKNLGFEQPLYTQYWHFLKGLVSGAEYKFGPEPATCHVPCFGYSFKNHLEVWPEMTSRIPVTISLAIGAAVLWLVSGITTGVISALKPRSVFDRLSMGVALAGVSLPVFFTGALLLTVFSYEWPILDNLHYVDFTEDPLMWARNLILPWISLAFLYSALYARLTRAGMLETMSEDYIRTARAKGLVERKVVVKHGLRSALTPIVTIFGMDLGLLLGGALITEQVFSLNGVGQFAVQAINDNDLPKVLGVTLLAAFFIVVCNLVVDLLYALVDPRVRLS
ncbi:ABC transporter permease [Kitasatospora aureofaciens]|uniref:ABC transporter permease n=1 Tax=Kitasatospora aureofaciens TaxID=1894 RepID=A0A1E7N8C4_KITAU|nr:ABC transporter permease [Kitasatospora aureofaciens]QEU99834.1 ABC transporter permease [Streptomyces viridifaciens]ARF78625.1 ABC transporter permease [Kitasatospora aureofaciens]OEV36929.1 ABC transporter permease [Kitasatospora aureofaciens]UKZ05979.1 ABC transporter permease [Streptomyces viridifaciens]GGU78723.1 ABC transporter permease [Kitasatospora aureofaciens]